MTAKVITVFNQKGGCGKSTSSMNLAGAIARMGLRVQVGDLDPQGTSSIWKGQAPEERPFPASVVNLSKLGRGLLSELRSQLENYDVIILDCPPKIEDATLSASLLVSDLALIPCQPSPADLFALAGARELLVRAQMTNPHLMARTLATAVNKRSKLAQQVMETMADDEDMPLLGHGLSMLQAYRECLLIGGTVHNVPGAATAVAELDALAHEVLELIGLANTKRARKVA